MRSTLPLSRAACCPQALMNELELMGRLQHPNIVRFVEYFLQDDPAMPHYGACIIVMDLLEGPDMMDFIDSAGQHAFSTDEAIVRLLLRPFVLVVLH
jgi:serine/threonine protein kinase